MSVLLVADTVPPTADAALSDVDWRRVDPTSAADALTSDPPEGVVLDWAEAGDEAPEILDAVGSAPTDVAVVVLADDHDVDAELRPIDCLLVRPVDPDALRDAVERARLVNEYDRVVGELFDRAQAEATAGDGPPEGSTEVGRLRRDADAVLDDLVALGSPDLLAALLDETGGSDAELGGDPGE